MIRIVLLAFSYSEWENWGLWSSLLRILDFYYFLHTKDNIKNVGEFLSKSLEIIFSHTKNVKFENLGENSF